MLKFIGIFFIILLFVVTLTITFNNSIKPVIAKELENNLNINDNEKGYKDTKLVVVSNINLENVEKEGFLKVIGVINGEDFVKKIPLEKLNNSTTKLRVTFSMDKVNDIVSAHILDEFFVCAYHFKNTNNNNNLKSISFDKKDGIEYFDCNEGDIKSISKPSKISLFKEKSQVYNKTLTYYNMYSKPKSVSFDTLDDDSIELANNSSVNIILDKTKKKSNSSNNYESKDKLINVKVIVPMEDKKNVTKIKIMTMLKGQIKSNIVDVKKEFDKNGVYTIERTFAFDRNTDIGPIQIGDRFHTCVIGNELYPPEGSKCDERLIKHLDKPNSLVAR
jgi:hypothetical protein